MSITQDIIIIVYMHRVISTHNCVAYLCSGSSEGVGTLAMPKVVAPLALVSVSIGVGICTKASAGVICPLACEGKVERKGKNEG